METFDLPELEAIQQDRAAIAAAEQALAQLKADARGRIIPLLAQLSAQLGSNTDLRADVIANLYWKAQDIPVQCIAGGFGVRELDIRETAKRIGAYIERACRVCGVQVNVPIKSRSDFQSQLNKNWGFAPTCDACKARQAESSKQYSIAYQARMEELQTMPYRDYLQTEEWGERRKRQLRRARYRCQVCNTNKARLNVHHRTYERRGAEDDRDLIVLCEHCHYLFHEQGKLAT